MKTTTISKKLTNLQRGSILSETSFFIVKETDAQSILVTDEHGNDVRIGNAYVESVLSSADYYQKEESVNMTELADLFISNPRVAMTVAFYKKDKPKSKRALKAEIAAKVQEIQDAKVSDLENLLTDLVTNPIIDSIPGEFRVMKGRHYGIMNDLGRIQFKDMEDKGSILKQVDPRTIQYLIVNEIKYSLK